jgi:prepilin-type N-terminal cleavage/methylation domain-containing protein/prepilin-type processing-associated H-X9-DG protein
MIPPPSKTSFRSGFTLMEILVTLSVIVILSLIAFQFGSRSIEKARWVVDLGMMRSINSAMVARATENNDIAYTKQETGNSVYREWKDPMSLCQILKEYLPGESSWLSPSANSRHKTYKNSYAWSQGSKISFDLEKPEKSYRMSQVENPGSVLTLWNNFSYTLPSGFNRAESNTVGPKQASKNFHHRPWNRSSAVNWLYLDGHARTF